MARRSVRAARRTGPIEIDGHLDEPAWAAAEVGDGFRQTEPDDGAPATVATRFRVLWDETSLYIGIDCDDPLPPTLHASRRDRDIEADRVQVDLDTSLDRRTAYHFAVYAAGQQFDGLHYEDTEFSSDWDAAWESAVALHEGGWSVEMRIPLRVLRIPEGAATFGLNLARTVTRRHERMEWQYRPRGTPGDVSTFGSLTGLQGIRPVRFLEVRPYIAFRAGATSPAPAAIGASFQPGPCSSVGLTATWVGSSCLGADLDYGLTGDLRLIGAINPEFGQVEVDERVLNLTTFETFLPEKRPFFLQGLDLFALPFRDAYQLFYSRRIGRQLDSVPTGSDEANLYQPAARPIAAAAKLAGSAAGVRLGALAAYEADVDAQVLQSDGRIVARRAAESALSTVARGQVPAGDYLLAGASATARNELSGESPRSSYAGALDLLAFDRERDWNLGAQIAGSILAGGTKSVLRDGTPLQGGSAGWAASARAGKEGGFLSGRVVMEALSPAFWVNDLGFEERGNFVRVRPSLTLRDLHRGPSWQRASLSLSGGWERNFAGFITERSVFLDGSALLRSWWSAAASLGTYFAAFDDRDLGDGTPLEKPAQLALSFDLDSDKRRPAIVGGSIRARQGLDALVQRLGLGGRLRLRPSPPLEARLDLSLDLRRGDVRRIRGPVGVPELGGDPQQELPRDLAAFQPRLYLLAQQSSRTVSATFHGTAALSSRASLQGLVQLFSSSVGYGSPQRAVLDKRRPVRLGDLRPALSGDRARDPAAVDTALNVDIIFRWEWRLGSTLYLVYARQTSNDVAPPPGGFSLFGDIASLWRPGTTTGDTFLVKFDVLSAW